MEEWEREAVVEKVVWHLVGISVLVVALVAILSLCRADRASGRYDAWHEACETARPRASE